MTYRIFITTGKKASEIADAVATNHGSWFSAIDGFGGGCGTAFVVASPGQDDDLVREIEDHDEVTGYELVK